MNGIEKKNPLNEREIEQKMLGFLLRNGYITEIEEYNDPKKVLDIEDKNFPEDVLAYIEILKKIIPLPIMSDSIEERITNKERDKIRDELFKKDPTLSNFYKDHNKLQSSNLAHILSMINMMGAHTNFSKELKFELEKLKFEFSGKENDKISANRYKSELDNNQKKDLAKRITGLAEYAILESVKK